MELDQNKVRLVFVCDNIYEHSNGKELVQEEALSTAVYDGEPICPECEDVMALDKVLCEKGAIINE